MNDLLVLGLVSTLLTGAVGDTVDATILAYSPVEQTVVVDNQSVHLVAQKTTPINVPVTIGKGANKHDIAIQTSTLTYHLTVTTVGKQDLRWLWGLTIIPAIAALLAFRLRKTQ